MVGMGTDKIFDASVLARAVKEIGYRFLDTASRYKNEHVVGEAV